MEGRQAGKKERKKGMTLERRWEGDGRNMEKDASIEEMKEKKRDKCNEGKKQKNKGGKRKLEEEHEPKLCGLM